MGYVLDTSALVDAWSKWYSPQSIPRFWERLEELGQSGLVTIPDAVLFELQKIDDDLYRWCKDRENIIVAPTTPEVQVLVKAISTSYPNLLYAGTPGKNFADPIVIALAEYKKYAVVTHEKMTGNLNGPRIPDVCKAKGIRVMQVHLLVLEQGWKFS
jgi:hypothetical protein